jgi:hypothetical protein
MGGFGLIFWCGLSGSLATRSSCDLTATVAGARLRATLEVAALVLRVAVLVFMGISWSIRRDHRGGDTLTLYSRNTSSHLLHYIHPINLGAPNQAECPQFGLTGLWRFSENGIGSACWNVRFQVFRTVTFDPKRTDCLAISLP